MDRFIDNKDGTITDTQTGLTWTKATLAINVPFEKAEETVSELGEGWRLPSITELFTLVDHEQHNPAIDHKAFPNTQTDFYWSSTKCHWGPALRWVVTFYYGNVIGRHRNNPASVRAVRDTQAKTQTTNGAIQ